MARYRRGRVRKIGEKRGEQNAIRRTDTDTDSE